jgi:hypothetical protein
MGFVVEESSVVANEGGGVNLLVLQRAGSDFLLLFERQHVFLVVPVLVALQLQAFSVEV